jgi:hypothetical protein
VLPLLAEIAGRDPVPILDRQADVFASVADHLRFEAAALDPTDARILRDAPEAIARVALREWLREGAEERYPPDAATIDRVMAVVKGEATATDVGLTATGLAAGRTASTTTDGAASTGAFCQTRTPISASMARCLGSSEVVMGEKLPLWFTSSAT